MTKQEVQKYVSLGMENADLNLLSYLACDVATTMEFISDCTDKEFETIAAYFEEIAYMSQNKSFIECIRDRFIHLKDKSLDLKYICDMIQYAEEVFPQEEY